MRDNLHELIVRLQRHSDLAERGSDDGSSLSQALEELSTALEEVLALNEALAFAQESTLEEQRRYRALFDLAPDPYVVTDEHGVILEANQAATRLFARQHQYLVGKPLAIFIPQLERARFRQHLVEIRQNAVNDWVLRLQPRQESKPVDVSLTVAHDSGAVGQLTLRWMFRDITAARAQQESDRRANEDLSQTVRERTAELRAVNAQLEAEMAERVLVDDELQRAYARMNEILETISDGFYAVDNTWRVTDVNAKVEELWGVPRDAMRERRLWDVFPQLEASELGRQHRRVAADGEPAFFETLCPISGRWIEVKINRYSHGLSVYFRDISDRKQAEETARIAHAYALDMAAAEERQRLARDLHDAVSQTLYSAAVIAETLPRQWAQDQHKVLAGLHQLARLNRGALAEMRVLLRAIRPDALSRSPLGTLLQELADATRGRKDMEITVTVAGTRELPSDVQTALYRIAQEALNNIVRHSHAATASIDLSLGPRRVVLEIRDGGRGFDAHQDGGGFGLESMRERAREIGAALEITSRKGRGTRVRARWPAPPARRSASDSAQPGSP